MGGYLSTNTEIDKHKLKREERLKGKEALLSMLEKTTEANGHKTQPAENSTEAYSPYYTLTPEEIVALVNGNIQQIENWVSKLNKDQASWLWKKLMQE